jgi:hypothetical protein
LRAPVPCSLTTGSPSDVHFAFRLGRHAGGLRRTAVSASRRPLRQSWSSNRFRRPPRAGQLPQPFYPTFEQLKSKSECGGDRKPGMWHDEHAGPGPLRRFADLIVQLNGSSPKKVTNGWSAAFHIPCSWSVEDERRMLSVSNSGDDDHEKLWTDARQTGSYPMDPLNTGLLSVISLSARHPWYGFQVPKTIISSPALMSQ